MKRLTKKAPSGLITLTDDSTATFIAAVKKLYDYEELEEQNAKNVEHLADENEILNRCYGKKKIKDFKFIIGPRGVGKTFNSLYLFNRLEYEINDFKNSTKKDIYEILCIIDRIFYQIIDGFKGSCNIDFLMKALKEYVIPPCYLLECKLALSEIYNKSPKDKYSLDFLGDILKTMRLYLMSKVEISYNFNSEEKKILLAVLEQDCEKWIGSIMAIITGEYKDFIEDITPLAHKILLYKGKYEFPDSYPLELRYLDGDEILEIDGFKYKSVYKKNGIMLIVKRNMNVVERDEKVLVIRYRKALDTFKNL